MASFPSVSKTERECHHPLTTRPRSPDPGRAVRPKAAQRVCVSGGLIPTDLAGVKRCVPENGRHFSVFPARLGNRC